MPEMPEVEQVRRTLEPHIKGKIFQKVEVFLPRLIQYPSAEVFAQKLQGRRIGQVGRRGKYLVIGTDGGDLIVHLRMTGALLAGKGQEVPPYAKIKFTFTDGSLMWFTDIRTFGTLYFVDDGYVIEGLATLGPEPLSGGLTADYLMDRAKGSRKPVKTFILDQTVIAGLGNIYADESLAVAGISPMRLAGDVEEVEFPKLVEAINRVISQGIRNHGTTFRDYKDGEGQKGSNQNFLLVYGRGGEPCKKCGEILSKIKVGGRGTVYCGRCQK